MKRRILVSILVLIAGLVTASATISATSLPVPPSSNTPNQLSSSVTIRVFLPMVSKVSSAGGPPAPTRTPTRAPQSPPPTPAPVAGIWLSTAEIQALPMSGTAWTNVKSAADQSVGTPDLANQDDSTNVLILAKALVYARTGDAKYRDSVITALRSITNSGTYSGRALALGRELAAYVISADLIGYHDSAFVAKVKELRNTPTTDGPANLIECHEKRANNWGQHCGATRVAIDRYIGDAVDLARAAKVFQGWLGDRSAYAGFSYGGTEWQADPSLLVGLDPTGSTIQGHPVDGVLPDDLRRGAGFVWPPAHTGYVWEALQGATVQAELLTRAGYPAWQWSDRALLRAVQWLDARDREFGGWWATSDDTWNPWLVNYAYRTTFRTVSPSSPGKNMGWTDWTHARP